MTNMLQEKVADDSSIKKREMKRMVILLRIFALLATTAATVVMALNKETRTFVVATIGNTPVKINIAAKFQNTPANIMFVIANGVATLHSLLMLSLCFVSHKCDFKGLRFLIVAALDMASARTLPLIDVMIALVSGAATAVAFMGELARNGNSHARWNKVCDTFERFCDRASGAMLVSYIGILFFMLVNLLNFYEHGRLINLSKSLNLI
ncbi:hypothetical protein E3N88_32378 [Mikania micrantha]|uniref:CASP-like protein n=1 Tax=Mikania micrantha TaxID=192012 RepID=A0A5N6M898_9ASTR|nr:hypothetical protein E3N88_32378 [Mikania micrantha]